MSFKTIFRLCGLAAILSGLFSVMSAFTALAEVFIPVMPELVPVVLMGITDMLTFFALFGLYGFQYKKSGMVGLAGVIFAMGGIFVSFLVPPVGRMIFLVGLCLLALANTRIKELPVAGYWMWFTGALFGIAGGFAGLRILLAFGLILSANGRVWLGAALWRLNDETFRPQAA